MLLRPASLHGPRILRAFSLVELVIVITIIGIIAAIAVPRISNASASSQAKPIELTITRVRKTVDVYHAEHGRYPGYNPTSGAANNGQFVDQLLMYTDADGKTSATRDATHIFRPYLRAPFPTNPMSKLNNVHVKATSADPDPSAGSVGWLTVLSTGAFGIFATDAELNDLGIRDAERKLDVRLK